MQLSDINETIFLQLDSGTQHKLLDIANMQENLFMGTGAFLIISIIGAIAYLSRPL